MTNKSTDELLKILKSAKNTSELKEYTNSLSSEDIAHNFSEFINTEISTSNIPIATFISLSQIQRNYAYQILDGRRNPSRDKVISMCLALKLDLAKTQRALTLSNNSQLYSKRKRDSILIFALGKKLSVQDTNELLYDMQELPLS